MTPNEDRAFTEFLLQKAAEAEALGYNPTKFKRMLSAQGSNATVRQLLANGQPSEGFTRLWELGQEPVRGAISALDNRLSHPGQ